jgi:hypothetical protein
MQAVSGKILAMGKRGEEGGRGGKRGEEGGRGGKRGEEGGREEERRGGERRREEERRGEKMREEEKRKTNVFISFCTCKGPHHNSGCATTWDR